VSKAGDADGFLSDVLGGRPMKDVYQVPFVNAAAWLVSRRCVETVGLFNPVFEHYGEDMEYADRVRHHGLRVGIAPAARVCHGRENRGLGRPSAARALVQDRATIRYRLARHGHPTRTNVLSALFYSVASGGHGAPWPRRWAHRARLLGGLIAETPRILQSRHITASQGLTFFESAAEDARRYFVDQQGLGRRER
jgi:GT2 family glycosyltransferase